MVPEAARPQPSSASAPDPVDRPHSLVLRSGPRLPEGFERRGEEIRNLRTELLMRQDDGADRLSLAILSAGAGEGRSQLAAELAIAFAHLGQPTLLVDADLRHPQQHVLFSASNERGLGSALSEHGPAVPIAVTGIVPLFLLCAGPPQPNPLELISDPHFDSLVRDWCQRYRYVVIDTPPVGGHADGLAIAHRVGQVLTLSRANHTSYRDTRELLRRLGATHSRIVGAVINRF